MSEETNIPIEEVVAQVAPEVNDLGELAELKREYGKVIVYRTVDEEAVKDVAYAMSMGADLDEALRAYHINRRQWDRTIRNCKGWREILVREKASFLVRSLREIAVGGKNAKGLMWLLERMYPERFSKKLQAASVVNEVTVNQTTNETVQITEQFCKLLNDVRKSQKAVNPFDGVEVLDGN